jgi:hypothetical protein
MSYLPYYDTSRRRDTMQVEYRTITRPVVWKLYVSPETGSHELTREDASRIAKGLSQSGHARVVFGGNVLERWSAGNQEETP